MPAIPPEMMKLMSGPANGAGQAGPPIATEPDAEGSGGPAGAPMTTPQQPEGDRRNAMVTVQIATQLLEQAIGGLGPDSEEGQAVLDVVGRLDKKFGEQRAKSKELMPAELMSMMSAMKPDAVAQAMGGGAKPPMPGAPGAHPMPAMPPGAMQH